VSNNKVLQRVKKENILQTIRTRKANWIGHILCRNCLLKHVLEGKIDGRKEVMGTWQRRCKQLLDDLREKTGYWKLKDEALGPTLWRTCLAPVARHKRIKLLLLLFRVYTLCYLMSHENQSQNV
jgi:hypothetical protein